MKKTIICIIAIIIIGVLVFIGSLGMRILNSAKEESDNISKTTNYYTYNGATMEYGEEWQQEYVGIGGKKYTALCEKNGDIIIICLQVVDINDGVSDYSLSSKRQELYDELIDAETAIYSAKGISISKQTNEFKELSNDLYYEYFEIYNNSYVRSYTILNPTNNTASSLMVVSDSGISDSKEKDINEILKTINF